AIHPSRQVPGNIGDLFALTDARLRLVDKVRAAAHALNSYLERHARTQRWLLKHQDDLLLCQRGAKARRMRFNFSGQVEDAFSIRSREVLDGNQAALRQLGQRFDDAHWLGPPVREFHAKTSVPASTRVK